MRKKDWQLAIGLSVIALMLAASMYVNVGVWRECRADHSFFYCLRLVSR